MIKRIIAIVFIFICTAIAWMILATTVTYRTNTQDSKIKSSVGHLWGTIQRQKAPEAYYETIHETKTESIVDSKKVTDIKQEKEKHPVSLDASIVNADLNLEHRQKGLLWYSTYLVNFGGEYRLVNDTGETHDFILDLTLPTQSAVYNNFQLKVGGKEIKNIPITSGLIRSMVKLEPGQAEDIEIGYASQGMDEWWYDFGSNVSQVKNFSLTMKTNFEEIDFPDNSISPTSKQQSGTGWTLNWKYANLLSGVQLGMVMPRKLNPGPWVSEVTFFAPVTLFLFFFLLFILTTIRGIKMHPMNYFFIGAAFFSFHLLLTYLVDHISIHAAFIISSIVSIFLVVTYMRLVVGDKFAYREVGISQFVYLVLFSYTYFFEGYTGLAITILCIITLFIVMQFTGRTDWQKLFKKENGVVVP